MNNYGPEVFLPIIYRVLHVLVVSRYMYIEINMMRWASDKVSFTCILQ